MTAQDKAREVLRKMERVFKDKGEARDAAIVAVGEILTIVNPTDLQRYRYWQTVIDEIRGFAE